MLVIKDLPKMTNAQLQSELKKRGLSESGKKAELVERLSEAIRKEEDAILNADADSTDLTGDASLAAAEALLDDETPEVASTIPEINNIVTSTESVEAPKDDKKKKSVDETQDAKLKRAQRFGLPIGTTPTVTTEDAKQKRAERFGIVSAVTSEDAKAKRAERFGIVKDNSNGNVSTVTSADAKAKRAERFGTAVAGSENKDKLFARAQRFGIPISADGKRTGADPEMEAKKKARAERFGL